VFLLRWWFLIDLFKLRVNATPPPAAVPADSPHQIEVGVEFKPAPVNCPLPEPSILHVSHFASVYIESYG
jgi:hypothetical protein